MCTCMELKTKSNYFGRNLDLEYCFNERVVITPRKYPFTLKNGEELITKYAIIGMATVVDDYPLYAEASNEKGLAMAGLYFPGNAYYNEMEKDKLSLAPYELIPYFLGQFCNLEEIKKMLENLNIIKIPFNDKLLVSELHWMISDGKECIVLEQTKEGLKVYQNPIGVLTNNPPFDYHVMNIKNYGNLTPKFETSRFATNLPLSQYGQGMGAIGLPGDNSPASRFVRGVFNKWNSVCEDDELSSVTQFFHVLDSVAMVRGATITPEGRYDLTTYSCCINTNEGIYYYKTYNNNQITAIRMNEENKNKNDLTIYELVEKQQIKYEN